MDPFRPIDRDTFYLMPPSVDEWVPERHLARFVVEVVAGLDLPAMTSAYRGKGDAHYQPKLLLGILVYGYATGVFSSRKLERATYDLVAFRFIAANQHTVSTTAMSASARTLCLHGASPCLGWSQPSNRRKLRRREAGWGATGGEPAVRRITNLFRRGLVASLLMFGEAWK